MEFGARKPAAAIRSLLLFDTGMAKTTSRDEQEQNPSSSLHIPSLPHIKLPPFPSLALKKFITEECKKITAKPLSVTGKSS